MLHEERELLADLARVNTEVPSFVLQFMGGEIAIEAEQAYARRLIDIGERLLTHAQGRKGLVLDGELAPVVIEGDGVVVDRWQPELPPGSDAAGERR